MPTSSLYLLPDPPLGAVHSVNVFFQLRNSAACVRPSVRPSNSSSLEEDVASGGGAHAYNQRHLVASQPDRQPEQWQRRSSELRVWQQVDGPR